MKHRVRQQDRGGTLLEVLVSLVIVTMVSSSMMEIASQRRRALAEGRRSETGMELAMQWRTANLQGQEWTRGEQGNFPGHDGINWALNSTAIEGDAAGIPPDNNWRQLTVILDRRNGGDQVSFLFRLDPTLPSLNQPGGKAP